MKRIVIFGNSGSGKSTLAKYWSTRLNCSHMDLDTVAWEPHKYSSPAAQDANLGMLIEWIRDYNRRTDEFSCSAHRRLFEAFPGRKQEFNTNERKPYWGQADLVAK